MDKISGNIKVFEPTEDFRRIHKSLIKNNKIDCLTLGIYAKIVEFGLTWKLNIKGLSKALKLSDSKIRKSIGILEKEGYIKRIPNHCEGKLNGWNYEVYPTPLDEKYRSNAGYKNEEPEYQCCAETSVTQKQTTLKLDNTKSEEDNNNRLKEYKDLKYKQTQEEKEIDKSIPKKSDDFFEKCWIAYRRKGVKKTSKAQWDKLTNEEKEKVLPHIKAYVSSRDVQFQKDFERYLRDKLFNDVVYNKNQVVYDPQRGETYAPQLGGNLFYNEELKCYMLVGGFYDETISDGYTDDERPNGARFMLNNGRGFVSWNRDTKKWEKENN